MCKRKNIAIFAQGCCEDFMKQEPIKYTHRAGTQKMGAPCPCLWFYIPTDHQAEWQIQEEIKYLLTSGEMESGQEENINLQ